MYLNNAFSTKKIVLFPHNAISTQKIELFLLLSFVVFFVELLVYYNKYPKIGKLAKKVLLFKNLGGSIHFGIKLYRLMMLLFYEYEKSIKDMSI